MSLPAVVRPWTGRRRVLGAAAAAAFAALVVGCGAPQYTYVTNSDEHTYLKVPAGWRQIDEDALGEAVGLDPQVPAKEDGLWLQGYDAAPAPSPTHLFGRHAADPAVFVGVRQVPQPTRGQVSLDGLRDFFFPVSPAGRQRAAAAPTSVLSDFALLGDEVLTPGKGLRGVHSVYRYRLGGGPTQVINQTMYTNDDASRVYMLFVRCSVTCYDRRKGEIESVVSSFTVREGP
jgi:hypothetical protein